MSATYHLTIAEDTVELCSSADPLQYRFPLPHHQVFYPHGFPIELQTNYPAVLDAAVSVWERCQKLRDARPVIVRVAVTPGSAPQPAETPQWFGQEHLVTLCLGPGTFVTGDLSAGFGFAWLSEAIAADSAYLLYHVLEPLTYLILGSLYCTPVHAACITLDGKAILLCGDTGAGKTSLAYACAKSGWTYLADDASYLERNNHQFTVLGRPHQIRFRDSAPLLFPELAAFAPKIRPNGKLDLEIDTAALGIEAAAFAEVYGVVLLERDASVEPAITEWPTDDTLRHLKQAICFGNEAARAEQIAQLKRLIELPAIRLRYSRLADAETMLRIWLRREA